MKTLAGLDRGRTYYLLDTTVCMDIVEGATGGPFGEFFSRAGRNSNVSFLIPPPIENEFGGFVHHNTDRGRSMPLVKRYLRGYGRCESKYSYPAEKSLRAQTRAVREDHPELSARDAYLLYLFRRHCSHADLRLLTSDAALRRAAKRQCRGVVIDPRLFEDPSRTSRT